MGDITSRDMDELANQIWVWCRNRNIFIFAHFFFFFFWPGTENEPVDFCSRHFSKATEWMLKSDIFTRLSQQLVEPNINMFASLLNARANMYPGFHSWEPSM